jgi:hypothetical protein
MLYVLTKEEAMENVKVLLKVRHAVLLLVLMHQIQFQQIVIVMHLKKDV